MKKSIDFYAIVLFVIVLVVVSDVAVAQSNNILDGIVEVYKEQASGWHSVIRGHAMKLFALLAAINVSYKMSMVALQPGSGFDDFALAFVRLFMPIMFFWGVLFHSDVWLVAIIDGMREIGGEASGIHGLSPSKIFDLGLVLVSKILGAGSSMGIADTIVLYFSAIIILVCFVMISAIMLVALVESYVVVSLGTMLLAFGSSEWTRDNATKQLMLAFSTGLKLMSLQMIVGIGQTIMVDFIERLGDSSMSEIFVVIGSSMVLLLLVYKIPDMLQSIVQGVSIAASTQALNTASNMASLASGGLASSASVAYSGGSAIKEAGKLASQQGATGALAKTVGAAGALAKAFGNDVSAQLKGMPNTRHGNTFSRMGAEIKARSLETQNSTFSGSIEPGAKPEAKGPINKPATGYENTKVYLRKDG